MSYRKLEVWELEKDVSIAMHPMTVDLLCDESIDHPETLQETGSLKDVSPCTQLHDQLNLLGRKLDLFIQSVELHLSGSEEGVQSTLQEETE